MSYYFIYAGYSFFIKLLNVFIREESNIRDV